MVFGPALQVGTLALFYSSASFLVSAPVILYCVLSFVLLRWPLFGRQCPYLLSPALRKVRCIGHRGARLEGVAENSLDAFAHAIKAGADMVELDVWLSKDGVVVVHHDATLQRMCDEDVDQLKTMKEQSAANDSLQAGPLYECLALCGDACLVW